MTNIREEAEHDCKLCHPAEHNAGGFYEYPKGTVFLKGSLGKELLLAEHLFK